MFLNVFTYADPLSPSAGLGTWRCSSPTDLACAALLPSALNASRRALTAATHATALPNAAQSSRILATTAVAAGGVGSGAGVAWAGRQPPPPARAIPPAAAGAGPQPAVPHGFCQMSRSQWEWTNPERSFVSEYSLICGRGWQVRTMSAADADALPCNSLGFALCPTHGLIDWLC
jgi:hypothetical protein